MAAKRVIPKKRAPAKAAPKKRAKVVAKLATPAKKAKTATSTVTSSRLRAQNESLRARLEEAEQTLEAIRSGKVDALVVAATDNHAERIFTLQGADHRYRRIVEGMTEGAVIVSARGHVLYANAAFSRLVGRPLDRVLGSKLRGYLPAGEGAAFDELRIEAQSSGGQAERATILRGAGNVVPVHVSATVDVAQAEGDVCFVVTDISDAMRDAERRRTQLTSALDEAVRERDAQQKLMESLFRDAPAAITFLRGPEHVVEVANAGTLALWNCTLEEAIGTPVLDLLLPSNTATFGGILGAVFRNGVPYLGNELPVDVAFGKEIRRRYVDVVYTPTRDPDGTVDGIAGFRIDVTSRVEARTRAEESEAQLRQLVDNLPELAWHALPNGQIDFYNRRWYEYTGTTIEEMNEHGWVSVHHPDLMVEMTERWEQSIASGQAFEMEFPLRGADGSYRWFLTRIRPLRDSDGNILRWFGTNTDIDDRKRSVDALALARDRAEEATRLKDEFLATLSHELRTPLNAILGWSRMLQSRALPEEKREHAVSTIVRNAVAQSQLIEDLLDLGRIISGKMRLNVETVDVASVVFAAIDVVQPAADAKGVRVQKIIDPDAGLVAGDAGRLQQVVWNLLSNAVKFTSRGGQVTVQVQRSDSMVEILIVDSGAGIAREFLPFVFDRFRQQDGAITRKAGGLGLGLAIVKSIVELHGGVVEANSDGAGAGATFVVRIPITALTTKRPPAAPVETRTRALTDLEVSCPPAIAGLRVLVVDDEADARDLLRALLEHCHANVQTAASVSEALAMVDAGHPDVIVSDIGMPEENGYSLIRRLRERSRSAGGSTPAIALTAYARPEDRRRALVEGFQNHIAKPVDPQELLLVVANAVTRNA